MVIDRVNYEVLITSKRYSLHYILTTFWDRAEVSIRKDVLPFKAGRGDLLRVKCRAQKKIKILEMVLFSIIMCIFATWIVKKTA